MNPDEGIVPKIAPKKEKKKHAYVEGYIDTVPQYAKDLAEVDEKNTVNEPYPVLYEFLRVLKAKTIFRVARFWSAILLVQYVRGDKKGKPALRFYRWELFSNKKDGGRMYWRKAKRWSINRPDDWEMTREIINRYMVQDWMDFIEEWEEKYGENKDDENE